MKIWSTKKQLIAGQESWVFAIVLQACFGAAVAVWRAFCIVFECMRICITYYFPCSAIISRPETIRRAFRRYRLPRDGVKIKLSAPPKLTLAGILENQQFNRQEGTWVRYRQKAGLRPKSWFCMCAGVIELQTLGFLEMWFFNYVAFTIDDSNN